MVTHAEPINNFPATASKLKSEIKYSKFSAATAVWSGKRVGSPVTVQRGRRRERLGWWLAKIFCKLKYMQSWPTYQ